MAGTVRLKDIADELNISVVTVSNALAGKKGVSDSVREKVIAKAREMGYKVSRYEEKEKKTGKIGVIIPEKYLEVGASFYWALYQQVVYAASKKHCFTLFEVLEKNVNGERELPRIIRDDSIDGLIFIGQMEFSYMERMLRAAKVPVVLLDYYEEGLSCDSVMSNNYIGMYKSTRYLLEKGHKDIAFVGSIEATDNIRDRYYGYRKALEERGILLRPEWKIEDRDIESGDIHITLPDNMPTAFACNCDYTAGYLYDILKEKGYRIPEDISITAYDNYIYGHPFANELTTYNVDMEKMAKTAVHILLKKIKGKDQHQGVRWVDGNIIERNSVKQLNLID